MTDIADTTADNRLATLMERPEFHLVYLAFYFIPWFFRAPKLSDMLAIALALIVFLPIYFRSFSGSTPIYLFAAAAIEGITLLLAPFNGMEGTFHIYAAACAGAQSDWRRGAAAILVLGLVYFGVSQFVMDAHILRTSMVVFMSCIIGATCMAGTYSIAARQARERALTLDRQLAAVEERERIAGDLHDILGHTLTMIAVKADLAAKLIETDADRSHQEIKDIQHAARSALSEVRETVTGMTHVTMAEEIARAETSLAALGITFATTGTLPPVLSTRASKAGGLAIREAITNIVKHSNATSVHLDLRSDDAGFAFTLSDNGKTDLSDNKDLTPGTGLQSLSRRISALGGRALIDMSDGVTLDIFLPQLEGQPS